MKRWIVAAVLLAVSSPCFAQFSSGKAFGSGDGFSIGAPAGASCTPGTHASNFLARTSGLSGTETTAYCNLINGLDSDSTFSLLDALYIFATNTTTTANLNLISTSFTLTKTGTVTFSADHGYTGDGSTGFFDTGYAPVTNGTALTANSVSLGVYQTGSRTTDSNAVSAGTAGNGVLGYIYMQPKVSGSIFADANGNTFINATNADAQGFYVVTRTSSTATAIYKNGSGTAIASSGSDAAGTLPAGNVYILAFNQGGATDFCSDQVSAAFIGGGLSSAQYVLVSNRINAFMTALGINVY